ncbi:iron complex transport system permease protein [Lachnospiraceae bacterium C7]|nr:iron complex transport system permease protein [Lachnospiraceae bacterium C7]
MQKKMQNRVQNIAKKEAQRDMQGKVQKEEKNPALYRKSRFVVFCIFMLVVAVVVMTAATLVGSVDIKAINIFKIMSNNIFGKKILGRDIFAIDWESSTESIIWNIRLPRVMLAFLVGAGLSLSGILMQALTRNAMADPYVLGISSGASCGAVTVIMYGIFGFMGSFHIAFGAMIGATISILLAMKIATSSNRITAEQLVLSGIAVSTLFSAITNLIIYYSKTGSDKVRTAMYWMMGSLNGATWTKVGFVFVIFVICVIVITFLSTSLDVLMLGDEAAITLGLDLMTIKIGTIAICTILTGSIVSVSGVIGFIGLIIPHITRGIVGSKHGRLIPASILIGGVFMMLCDLLSRVVVAPEELPVGVLTAMFGAPFFLWMIKQSHGGK